MSKIKVSRLGDETRLSGYVLNTTPSVAIVYETVPLSKLVGISVVVCPRGVLSEIPDNIEKHLLEDETFAFGDEEDAVVFQIVSDNELPVEIEESRHRRDRCMETDCNKAPTTEFLWAEGMACCWLCDDHVQAFREREMWNGVSQINSERKLAYGVASKHWRDGPVTQQDAEDYRKIVRESVITSQSWPVALGDSSHKLLLDEPITRKKKSKLWTQYPPLVESNTPPDEFGDVEGTTRSDKAWSFWNKHWQNVLMQYSSANNNYILHIHWRGLSEREKDWSLDKLMKTRHSVHMDLRMELPTFWTGWSIFTGTVESNDPDWKIKSLNGVVLQVWPKYVVPKKGIKKWLTFARDNPQTSPPGGVGSTTDSWAKFFVWDYGTWRLGVANRSFVEVFLDGKEMKGRYIFQRAETDDRRFWILRKPSDQQPYAKTHSVEETMDRLKARGHSLLIWGSSEDAPTLYNIDTRKPETENKLAVSEEEDD